MGNGKSNMNIYFCYILPLLICIKLWFIFTTRKQEIDELHYIINQLQTMSSREKDKLCDSIIIQSLFKNATIKKRITS
jgi:hypothetical protein